MFKSPLMMTWFDQLLKFGTGLILLPIATRCLSAQELAFYVFIGTLLSFAYLAEGGINKVVSRAATYFNEGMDVLPNSLKEHNNSNVSHNPNFNQLGVLIATSRLLYICLAFLSFLLLFFLGSIISDNLISLQPDIKEAKTSLFIISLYAALYVFQLRYFALVQGLNFLAKQKRIEVFFGLLRMLLIIISLVNGFGIIGIALSYLFTVIISNLFNFVVLNNILPKYKYEDFEVFSKSMLFQLYPSSWRQLILAWGSFLIYYSTSILIVQANDPNEISSFLLTQQIIFLLVNISGAPARSSYPEISIAIIKKDQIKFKKILRRTSLISLGAYAVGALAIIFLANLLLDIIGSNTRIIDGSLLYFILFVYLLEVNHVLHATFYTASNHIPFVLPSIISGIVILCFGYLAIGPYGIFGVVFVHFVVQLSFNNWYPIYMNLKLLRSLSR